MSLKIIHCSEPTIDNFIDGVKKLNSSPIISVFKAYDRLICEEEIPFSVEYIVLGKIRKITVTSVESKRMVILMKEILSNNQYGVNFKTIIYGDLVIRLLELAPTTGDRLGFFTPMIRPNPVFRREQQENSHIQQPYYLLECCSSSKSILWFAKKKIPEIKEASIVRNIISSSNTTATTSSPHRHTKKVVKALPDSTVPQRSCPTQPLNPRYKYKTLTNIKKDAALTNMERTNLFAVVREVSKPLTRTSAGKFTIICRTVDDSMEIGDIFCLHFFCHDDVIIKQIEQDDVLRLHRVKIEKFGDVVDGRIFSSFDVVLFKGQSKQVEPVTVAKTTSLTDDEKERVKMLKKWHKKRIRLEATNAILLKNVHEPGLYAFLCQVVSYPNIRDENVVLEVTEGSDLRQLQVSSKNAFSIIACKEQASYSNLKIGDIVFFPEVKVCICQSGWSLSINNHIIPYKLDQQSDPSMPVFIKVKEIEEQFQETNNKPEINELFHVDSLDDIISTMPLDSIIDCVERNSDLTKEEFNKFLPCANKSCIQQFSNKERREVKTNINNVGSKGKKTLLKPNYVNLSYAIDEEVIQKMPSPCDIPAIHSADSSSHSQDKSCHKTVAERLEKRSLNQAEACLDDNINVGQPKRLRLESETNKERAESTGSESEGELAIFQLTNLHDLESMLESEEKEEESKGLDTDLQMIVPPGQSVRLKLYLIKVIPDPFTNPLELVSGYCHTSCHKLLRYSKILWRDQHNIPLCPLCSTAREERRLELIFMMEWHIMDTLNDRESMILCRESAQQFLKCSVEEFLKDETLRHTCMQLLSNYYKTGTENHPLLDVSVKLFSHKLFLVSFH